MALLASLEKAIKLCKEEQDRLHSCIERHRELLTALAPQPKAAPDESEPFRPAETDTSPGETEDLKLLEQALEKALRVRTGGVLSKNSRHLGGGKELAAREVASNKVKPVLVKGNEARNSSKPAPRHSSVSSSVSSKSAHLLKSTKKIQRPKTSLGTASKSELSESVTSSLKSDNPPLTDAQQTGLSTDLAAKWKLLKNKQSRLWDKVSAAQRKDVPGRSRFMERLSATFPEDWPCGSPDQIRALVGSMTHRGNENQTLLDQGATEPEWEAWDRWRPEGGCFYTAVENLEERDGVNAPLPRIICYRTKAELTELERLRTKVAILQQEVGLQQALLDALSSQLASIGSGCSDPTVLRDLYSLLGEGGQRFPAIVLDCD